MSFQSLVLIYGHDSDLLRSRRWVLEKTGYRVVTTTELTEIGCLAENRAIDLVVLCHTLTLEECGRALALACTRWPSVQSLVLTSAHQGCVSLNANKFLDTSAGPAMLVHMVGNLVHQANQGSSKASGEREEGMAQFEGSVRWFNNAKGYGILGHHGVKDVPMDSSSIETNGRTTLKQGEVGYDVTKGPQADRVLRLQKSA